LDFILVGVGLLAGKSFVVVVVVVVVVAGV
jgi:hypothetical protein